MYIPTTTLSQSNALVPIFESTLAVAAANFDVTGIPATKNHIVFALFARGDTAATNTGVNMRFNGDSGANYDWDEQRANTSAVATSGNVAQTSVQVGQVAASTAPANCAGLVRAEIMFYTNGTYFKNGVSQVYYRDGTGATNQNVREVGYQWRSTATINQITLIPAAGNFDAGSKLMVYLYG